MRHDEFVKKLNENGICIVSDGIGNTNIYYIVKTDDSRKELNITLGGYCDIEPFKWEINTDWKVKEKTKCYSGSAWDIISTKTIYIDSDFGAGHYDSVDNIYLADENYLNIIIDTKNELLKILPELLEKSKIIFEDKMKNIFSLRVERIYITNKWQGRLVYKGKTYRTKQHKTFFEAKEELDSLYNMAYNEDPAK